MKRATITVSDDLEPALEAYLRDQEVPPSLTRLLQAALREFLSSRGYSGAHAPAARRTGTVQKARRKAATQEVNETDTTLL